MIETLAACVAGVAVLVPAGVGATRRRRCMRRQETPRFVFADLAGYTTLTWVDCQLPADAVRQASADAQQPHVAVLVPDYAARVA